MIETALARVDDLKAARPIALAGSMDAPDPYASLYDHGDIDARERTVSHLHITNEALRIQAEYL